MAAKGSSEPSSAGSGSLEKPTEITEQDLQSRLFRLAILLATALSTIDESVSPNALPAGSALPSRQAFIKLSEQLHNDLLQLFALAQKTATNLTLALRPSRNATDVAAPSGSNHVSPIAGLDTASLAAASAQLDTFSSEVLPKLTFLARKAVGEAQVLVAAPPRVLSPAERVERARLEHEVAAMGGRVMDASDVAPPSKVTGLGLGLNLTKAIRSSVREVMESVAGLCTALMDAKTLQAVQRAAAARARADGLSIPLGAAETPPQSAAKARRNALEATAKVWAACDQATKDLPTYNKEVILKKWGEREEIMEDGWNELREGSRVEDAQAQAERHERENRTTHAQDKTPAASRTDLSEDVRTTDDSDPFAALQDLGLNDEEAANAAQFVPLIEQGRLLHTTLGQLLRSTATKREGDFAVDYDELHTLGERMLEAQDDLVAALLYGEQELGGALDFEDEDDESGAEEGEEEGHQAAEARANSQTDDGVEEEQERATTLSEAVDLYVKVALRIAQESGIGPFQTGAAATNAPSSGSPSSRDEAIRVVRLCIEELSKLGKHLSEQSDAAG